MSHPIRSAKVVATLVAVASLLSGCGLTKAMVEQSKAAMESYPSPKNIDSEPGEAGLLLIDVKCSGLTLDGVAIANSAEPQVEILSGTFGTSLLGRSRGALFPNLVPGTYQILRYRASNQQKWEMVPFPFSPEYIITIDAGVPTYVGRIVSKKRGKDIKIEHNQEDEVEAWEQVIKKFDDSPWVPVIEAHLAALQ